MLWEPSRQHHKARACLRCCLLPGGAGAGERAGWLTAGSLRGQCQLMSIPSPGRKGEVIYILQEEGVPAVTSLTGRPRGAEAQGREGSTGGLLLLSQSDCSIGRRSPGGALLPSWPDCRGTSLRSPPFSFHHHLRSHPGAAAGQPLDLSARALFLQLGSRGLTAGCICLLLVCLLLPTPSIPPPPCICPSGVLSGLLRSEAEALGEKQMAALLPLSPNQGKLLVASLFCLFKKKPGCSSFFKILCHLHKFAYQAH